MKSRPQVSMSTQQLGTTMYARNIPLSDLIQASYAGVLTGFEDPPHNLDTHQPFCLSCEKK
jgi:hypothetical protein